MFIHDEEKEKGQLPQRKLGQVLTGRFRSLGRLGKHGRVAHKGPKHANNGTALVHLMLENS